MGTKESKCIFAGIGSGVVGAIGVGILCAATGGLGGILVLGAGIAGATNTVQQALNGKADYSVGSLVTDVVVGTATSAITAGAGLIGGKVVSKFALEGTKKVAAMAVSRGIAGAASSVV